MANEKIDEVTETHTITFPKDSWEFSQDKDNYFVKVIDKKKFHVTSSKLSKWKYVDDNEKTADNDICECKPIWLVDPRYLPTYSFMTNMFDYLIRW